MIQEIYNKIRERLETVGEIKHIDLWNRNVEFASEETCWERPAIFVEFSPIRWEVLEPGSEYRSQPEVLLHIVTDWTEEGTGSSLELAERIHGVLADLSGESFYGLDLTESRVNHDHEELVETIEIYKCDGLRVLE